MFCVLSNFFDIYPTEVELKIWRSMNVIEFLLYKNYTDHRTHVGVKSVGSGRFWKVIQKIKSDK